MILKVAAPLLQDPCFAVLNLMLSKYASLWNAALKVQICAC